MNLKTLALALPILLALAACNSGTSTQEAKAEQTADSLTLLNVSYDPTRELYQEYNALFQAHWRQQTGQTVTIQQSHGGSGKQALSIIHGLQADVTTLALAGDIDSLNLNQPLLKATWQQSLPDNSTPYTSTIVFLVRKGNPKNIHDWDDLIKGDVSVITPNPKTSGGARWNFLAAWDYAKHKANGSDAAAEQFVRDLYQRVPVLDSGARGATMTFTQRNIGDVLLAWENEAYLALKVAGDDFEIITPSRSILCEPPVAVVDAVVDKKGTRQVAEAYLEYLYSEAAQRVIAKNFYRPINDVVKAEFKDQFAPLELVTIDAAFGGWAQAQKTFFDDGAVFDRLYAPSGR
ncbi:MAG: sulfate ABC transporter substrate-binding protein [Neisseriaceae bacterium]|nr:sulfate ABC transporter substrate-binding protein [Neisseriaceae bacterium]MBP6862570.1 sulfate ABC transporter substrate-binding protein [Neisseriaceae bacterium]